MKRVVGLVLIVLVAAASIPNTIADAAGNGEERLRLSVDFNLVAVVEGKDKGVLIPATLTITYPGNGTVLVNAGGGVGDITLKSTVQAVKLASLLSGVDWRQWDFNLTIHTDSGIDGPSGSVMVALVAYTLLSGAPTGEGFKGIVVTGAVSPDGLASSVGGVEYKCQAAGEGGLAFYYPLVNYTSKLAETCSGYRYTGILNLTSQVFHVSSPPTPKPPFTLPQEFNETMRAAAERMAGMAEDLLEKAKSLGVANATIEPIENTIRQSKSLLETHPYAAASLAFSSLRDAYSIYLTGLTMNKTYKEAKAILDDVAENVSKSLDSLEQTLDRLPRNGSIYYVEFVATAYTRLAAARSSLIAYHNYSESAEMVYDYAIPELAHAAARITSIEEWIKSANATRSERPTLSSSDIERLAWILRDYATTSGDYASSLAEYAVKYYGRSKSLLVYIDILGSLQERAVEYMNQSNYLAAIGFYRELLSQSLNVMFQASIQAYKGPGTVIPDYMKELTRLYDSIVIRLLNRGLTPGLAPAYYDYAIAEEELNNTEASILLKDEAVVSAMVWDMLTIAHSSINKTTSEYKTIKGQSHTPTETIILATVVALMAYVVGYLSSIKSVAKILRESLES